jgi:hypothetical protein
MPIGHFPMFVCLVMTTELAFHRFSKVIIDSHYNKSTLF